MKTSGLKKRENKRNLTNSLFENETYTFKISNKNINFKCLKNFSKLFNFHFQKYKSPFLNFSNCDPKSNFFSDFRSGLFYLNFLEEIVKFSNIILYLLYFDSTKIKTRNIFTCYLSVLNDQLNETISKKVIYNISFIDEKNLKIIGLQNYLSFLITKFKEEVEIGMEFQENVIVPGFLFNVLRDNAEIYSILNLKISFGKSRFPCRICDFDCKCSKEEKIHNIETFNKKNNDWYDLSIRLSQIDSHNEKITGVKKEKSKIFLLKHIHYLYSFSLDIQHIEAEGEIQRDIILLFLKFQDYSKKSIFDTNNCKKMMIFLRKIRMKTTNVEFFLKNIGHVSNKIFQSPGGEFSNISLTSGEAMVIFSIAPVFFYNFFSKNLESFFIQIFLNHSKYFYLLMKKKISKDELELIDFYVKQRLKLLLENNLKVFFFFFFFFL